MNGTHGLESIGLIIPKISRHDTLTFTDVRTYCPTLTHIFLSPLPPLPISQHNRPGELQFGAPPVRISDKSQSRKRSKSKEKGKGKGKGKDAEEPPDNVRQAEQAQGPFRPWSTDFDEKEDRVMSLDDTSTLTGRGPDALGGKGGGGSEGGRGLGGSISRDHL